MLGLLLVLVAGGDTNNDSENESQSYNTKTTFRRQSGLTASPDVGTRRPEIRQVFSDVIWYVVDFRNGDFVASLGFDHLGLEEGSHIVSDTESRRKERSRACFEKEKQVLQKTRSNTASTHLKGPVKGRRDAALVPVIQGFSQRPPSPPARCSYRGIHGCS